MQGVCENLLLNYGLNCHKRTAIKSADVVGSGSENVFVSSGFNVQIFFNLRLRVCVYQKIISGEKCMEKQNIFVPFFFRRERESREEEITHHLTVFERIQHPPK